jgi:uncharacterized protein YeaO (DUF488 family)
VLAPSVALLRDVLLQRRDGRAGPAGWRRYVQAYEAEWAARRAADPAPWDRLVARGAATGLVLVCSCQHGHPCHRTHAAQALVAHARGALAHEGEVAP